MDTFERDWAEKTGQSFFESTTFPFSIPSLNENDLKFSGITPIKPSFTATSSLKDKKLFTKEHQRKNSGSPSKLDIPEMPDFTWEEFDTTSSDIDGLAERVQSLLHKKDARSLFASHKDQPEVQRGQASIVETTAKSSLPKEINNDFQSSQLDILPEVHRANQLMSEFFKSNNLGTDNSGSSSSLSSQNEDNTLIDPEKTKVFPRISFSTYLLSDRQKEALVNTLEDPKNSNSNNNNARDEILSNVDQVLAKIRGMKERILACDEDSLTTEGSTNDSATLFNAHSIETVKTNASKDSSKASSSKAGSSKNSSNNTLKNNKTDSNNNPNSTSNSVASRNSTDALNSILGLNAPATKSTRSSASKARSSTKIDNLLNSNDSIEYIPISPLKKSNNSQKIESILKNILQEDKSVKSKSSQSSSKASTTDSKSKSRVSSTSSRSSFGVSNPSSRKSSSSGVRNSTSGNLSSNPSTTISSLSSSKNDTASKASKLSSNSSGSVQLMTVREQRSPPKNDNDKRLTTIINKPVDRKESAASTIVLEDTSLCSNTSSLPEPNRTIKEQRDAFLDLIERNENYIKQVQKELLLFEKLYKRLGKEKQKKVQFEEGHISFEGVQQGVNSRPAENNSRKMTKKKFTKDEIENSRIQHQRAKLERKNHNEESSESSLITLNDNCSSTFEKRTKKPSKSSDSVQCRETRPKSQTELYSLHNHKVNNFNHDNEQNEQNDDDGDDDDQEEHGSCTLNGNCEQDEQQHHITGKVQKSNKMNCGKTLRSRSSSASGHCYCCIVRSERQIRLRSHCVKTLIPSSSSSPSSASQQTKAPLRGNNTATSHNSKHSRIETNSSTDKNVRQHSDKQPNSHSQSHPKRSSGRTTKVPENFNKTCRNMARDDCESQFSLDSFHDDFDEKCSDASRASSAAYVVNVNRSVQTSIMIDNTPRPRTPQVNSSSLFSGNCDPFFSAKKAEIPTGPRRPIVYFLPLDSVPTKSPPRKSSREALRHSMIQVPVRSSTLPAPELTIQEAFSQRCTAFRQRSAARVKRIRASAERRIETADQRRRAIAQSYANKLEQDERSRIKPVVVRSGQFNGRRFENHKGLTHKEMRAQTEKIYRRLPEVRAADKWAKKEDEAKRRRVMADIFKQRLKENAIRGKLNWPITTLAITAL